MAHAERAKEISVQGSSRGYYLKENDETKEVFFPPAPACGRQETFGTFQENNSLSSRLHLLVCD